MKGFNSFPGRHFEYLNKAVLKIFRLHEYFIKQEVQPQAGKF